MNENPDLENDIINWRKLLTPLLKQNQIKLSDKSLIQKLGNFCFYAILQYQIAELPILFYKRNRSKITCVELIKLVEKKNNFLFCSSSFFPKSTHFTEEENDLFSLSKLIVQKHFSDHSASNSSSSNQLLHSPLIDFTSPQFNVRLFEGFNMASNSKNSRLSQHFLQYPYTFFPNYQYFNHIEGIIENLSLPIQTLKEITKSSNIVSIFPLLLQYLISQGSLYYDNPVILYRIAKTCLYLLKNPHISSDNFTLSFINLSISFLLHPFHETSSNENVRKIGAHLINEAINKFCLGYPHIRLSILNYLLSILFSSTSTIGAHLGIILALRKMRIDIFAQLNNHFNILFHIYHSRYTLIQKKLNLSHAIHKDDSVKRPDDVNKVDDILKMNVQKIDDVDNDILYQMIELKEIFSNLYNLVPYSTSPLAEKYQPLLHDICNF